MPTPKKGARLGGSASHQKKILANLAAQLIEHGAIKTTERRLAEGKLEHADQPLMSWCVSNCRVEPRANSILITKQASGSAKIDPVMALFNAISLMALNPAAAHKKFQMLFL